MDTTHLLLCLALIAGAWAKSADGDLNLKSIFRTPRDFSKVNFDHFELLERNNFNDENKEPATEKREIVKAEDKKSKSMANAQVMLRIGGEDIHDCNRVILHHPPNIKENNYYSQHPQPAYNNEARYPYYPHSYAGYPYVHQPVSFPGYYYNPHPVQNYLPSSYQSYQTANNHPAPSEFTTKSPDGLTTLTYIEEGSNPFPVQKQSEIYTQTPKSQVILEKPSSCDVQIKSTEIVHTQNEQTCAPVVEKTVSVTHSEPVQTTVVETPCGTSQTVETASQECSTPSPVCVATDQPPTRVEYVEVNLGTTEKPCLENVKEELVQHTVEPISCEKTQETVVVSQPEVIEEKTVCTTPQEQLVVSEAASSGVCSCDRERDSSIPYGHRFSKDVDSLHEITDNALYNEGHSVTITNVRHPLEHSKLETVSVTTPREESHSQCSVLTHHYPQKEVVQVVNPSHETVEQHYVAQEAVQHNSPNTVTKVETPCETKTVITEQQVPSLEWSSQQVCAEPSQVTVVTTTPGPTESPYTTQELVQVSNQHHNSLTPVSQYQTEWSVQKETHSPQGKVVHTLQPCQESYTQELVQEPSKGQVEVTESPCSTNEVRVEKPVVYYRNRNSRGGAHISVDLGRYGNGGPKIYLEGYDARCGSGYYSDPIRSVVYRHPLVIDSFKSHPSFPVVERIRYIEPNREVLETVNPFREHLRFVHPLSSESYRFSPARQHGSSNPRISEPHIYRIVPKFDIIPRRDIRNLNIPDLVHTNQYLKINVPHRPVSYKEYVQVDKAPARRKEFYLRKSGPYWKNASAHREAQAVPACQTRAGSYKGELDELS